MLTKYRFVIAELRARDPHFARLFYQHHDINRQIRTATRSGYPNNSPLIETLTRKKLEIRSQMDAILRRVPRE
ncbi:DUF465 domain-containing protein [Dyella amyloliquefaciens]|uniref:YdcH family protein n=1 Tax=Dyella amyloliquefaciens TaxID=1770545 RepID=UPI00102EC245